MRNVMFVVLILFVIGCNNNTAEKDKAIVGLKNQVQALQHDNDSLVVLSDSLRERLKEQIVLVQLAKQQMTRYAKIVERNPSQSKFLVGWTRRAFEGTITEGER